MDIRDLENEKKEYLLSIGIYTFDTSMMKDQIFYLFERILLLERNNAGLGQITEEMVDQYIDNRVNPCNDVCQLISYYVFSNEILANYEARATRRERDLDVEEKREREKAREAFKKLCTPEKVMEFLGEQPHIENEKNDDGGR